MLLGPGQLLHAPSGPCPPSPQCGGACPQCWGTQREGRHLRRNRPVQEQGKHNVGCQAAHVAAGRPVDSLTDSEPTLDALTHCGLPRTHLDHTGAVVAHQCGNGSIILDRHSCGPVEQCTLRLVASRQASRSTRKPATGCPGCQQWEHAAINLLCQLDARSSCPAGEKWCLLVIWARQVLACLWVEAAGGINSNTRAGASCRLRLGRTRLTLKLVHAGTSMAGPEPHQGPANKPKRKVLWAQKKLSTCYKAVSVSLHARVHPGMQALGKCLSAVCAAVPCAKPH